MAGQAGGLLLRRPCLGKFVAASDQWRDRQKIPDPVCQPARKKGESTAMINVLWGFANLVIAYLLLCQVGNFALREISCAAPFGAGILAGVIMCARLFAYLHGGT